MTQRPEPVEAARALIAQRFSECTAAFLGGSVIRGDHTATSDLDIVLFTPRQEAPFRESLRWQEWPVELFVQNDASARYYFEKAVAARHPGIVNICVEGVVLRSIDGHASRVQAEAQRLLAAGPAPLTLEEADTLRYGVTDLLEDFLGSERPEESLFIANMLAVSATELLLMHHRQWCGRGKWLHRALKRYDPALAARLTTALQTFYATGDKQPLIRYVEAVLAPVGGPLFDGYYKPGHRGDSSVPR